MHARDGGDLASRLSAPDSGKALADLIDRFGRQLFTIALKWYGLCAEDAEEVLNDTLLAATTSISQFDPAKGSFKSWLIGIACNRARRKVDTLRKERHSALQDTLPARDDPSEMAGLAEIERQIRNAMREMTPLQCDIIRALMDGGIEAVTDKAIAARHATTPQTVKVERWRVRRALAVLLGRKAVPHE